MAKKREWTLMFYLASDNPLAPGIMSQLKTIKAAGFHKDANVIVQFDPYTEETPTHVFDVNGWRRVKEESEVGFKADSPWVYNVLEDRLWGAQEFDRHGELINTRIKAKYEGYEPPLFPPKDAERDTEPNPKRSLCRFINFSAEHYPASRYMLFILGHGLVVGTQNFLYDEHADQQSLGLKDLGEVLHTFRDSIKRHDGTLELLSFHSCSVSSLEVAYELKDYAHYMLASQGTTFVGSWPYRQILVRIFNSLVKKERPDTLESMLRDVFYYCVHNSTDFLLAGYPFHLCLCDLKTLTATRDAIGSLSRALINALESKSESFKDSILLAHLKSQSFHEELYTDLADFCRCLFRRTEKPLTDAGDEVIRTSIQKSCSDVVSAIQTSVVSANFAGPEYQYAKGLSIYFPWSQPLDSVWKEYEKHRFNDGAREGAWSRFLKVYFDRTIRDPFSLETPIPGETAAQSGKRDELFEDQVAQVYSQAPLQVNQAVFGSLPGPKTDKGDPMGGQCSCPSIKNYPRDTRGRRKPKDESKPVIFDTFAGRLSQGGNADAPGD